MKYEKSELIYENDLSSEKHIAGFVMEGSGEVSFSNGRLRLENLMDPNQGQSANIVFWCPLDFPDNIEISWDYYPIREPGLCMMFFSAAGRDGVDIFHPSLNHRNGMYKQYHSGDIHTLHVSYFRRKAVKERAFNVCNLRKSPGFHLVAQGADPIPSVENAIGPYRMIILKMGPYVEFRINQLTLFSWEDDGASTGKLLRKGKIGFRQMAPLIGEYANLNVYKVK